MICNYLLKSPFGSRQYCNNNNNNNLACFRSGSNWGPCECEAHVMTTTLQKLAWSTTSSVRCGILLFLFSVNKTPNACFCPGSNWGPCARKAHVMTVTLHKQAHARNLYKLPQYQTLKIDRKFIHLILPHQSIWILLLKQ